MATYKLSTTNGYSLALNDRPLYGSSRLGSFQLNEEMYDHAELADHGPEVVQPVDINYELTDHLGNVTTVVTGRLLDGNGGGTPKQAEVTSAQGYEPFGSLLPGRNYSSDSYRFGFNGMPKDDEVLNATGTSYDFGARIYDSRVGRWLAVDPRSQSQPSWSVYKAYYDNPIVFIDPNGETEYKFYIRSFAPTGTFVGTGVADDGRTTYSVNEASARVHNSWVLDTEAASISNFTLRGQDTHLGSKVFPAKESSYKRHISEVTQRRLSGQRNLLMFTTSYSAGNGITGDYAPEIDVKSRFWIQEDKKNHELRVGWAFGTDDFPATEGVIEDPSGQRVMIGWAPADGHPTVTLTGGVDSFHQFNVIISTNEEGNFTGVRVNGSDKTYSIEAWNNYAQAQCTNCDNQQSPVTQKRAKGIVNR